MVKKEALSSDLRFIKEVEELKIKQKLLIESLKRKNSDEQNKLFLEINSKLDFLVNIFNEANKPSEEAEEEDADKQSQFAPILEKIDELSETINKRFTEIESKLVNLKQSDNNEDEFKDEPKKEEPAPPKLEEKKKPELTAPQLEEGAPAPDFKSDIKQEGDKAEGTKKKKWF